MRLAVTVEILVRGIASGQRSLPQLAQVGVDEAVAVAGITQGIAERATATGAVACPGLRARVACPYQPVLLIVAEVGGLAAPEPLAPGTAAYVVARLTRLLATSKVLV